MQLVLTGRDVAVVEEGVAHHERGSCVEAGREVVDHGGSLVEDHVETQAVVTLLQIVPTLHAVSCGTALELVVLVNHEAGHEREVEQPL